MKANWFQIINADTGPTEVLLYGEIGGGWGGEGKEFEAFAAELADIPKDQEILLRVHSPGGSVFDGLAMYNILNERRDKVTARVDGLAASAASWIALAAKRTEMPKHARMMIHDAQGLAIGDSSTLREVADLLESESDRIAGIYAEKTGKPAAEMRQLMKDTTWMDGKEAKAAGFVDAVIDGPAVKNEFDLSRFKRVPESLGSVRASTNTQTKEEHMENKQVPVEAPKSEPENINIEMKTQLEALQNKLRLEKSARLRAIIEPQCAERGVDPEKFIKLAEADESLAIDSLNAIPKAGGEPTLVVENKGNPMLEAYNAMGKGMDRNEFRVNNHQELMRVRQQFDPQNSNTVAAGLLNDYLDDAVIVAVNNKLAMLNAFTMQVETSPLAPLAKVDVRKATAGGTAQSNATNFESGDSTLAAATVTVTQTSVSYHLLNSEFQSGHRLAHLAQMNANNFSDAISDLVTAVMVTGTYGTAITIGAAANFDTAELSAIYAGAKNYARKNLLLDGGHLAYLLPTDKNSFRLGEQGAYGFDLIAENNRWTDATTNTAGFVCGPEAIVIATGPSLALPRGQYESVGSVQNKQGLSVQTASWYNTAGRVWWASFDSMFGAIAGDAGQGEVLITA